MPKELLIFPFGGNAREAASLILGNPALKKEWKILGFIDDDPRHKGQSLLGLKVLGTASMIKKFPRAKILAVPGNSHNYQNRDEIISRLNLNFNRFATVIHPSVVCSPDAAIGYNTLLMPCVVLGSRVMVGNHCIILPHAAIAHDSVIEDYCCLGSQVIVSGSVRIGRGSYVGSAASIRDNIIIGDKTLVGIGANVVANLKGQIVYAGNPARAMRKVNI